MYTQIWTAALSGVEAQSVRVECHAAPGLPKVVLTGLPDKAIQEAVPRIFSAARLSGLPISLSQRIVINLVPGDLRKSGSAFDLPIALGLLAALGLRPAESLGRTLVLGELALDGRIEPVRGVLSLVCAREEQVERVLVPADNLAEARAGCSLPLAAASTLREALTWLVRDTAEWGQGQHAELDAEAGPPGPDLAHVRGQQQARRALEIAAAGGHNLLLVGSPGSGKTLLARCLPGILPPLSPAERLEASRIHSVAGLLPPRQGLLRQRPFRAPHATISDAGLVGSGRAPHVGEVSLAHRGVLFLDELPQFRRQTLEQLRQPLEDGRVLISRAALRLELPARFTLVAAMNPCPCGMLGDPRRRCRCPEIERLRYASRISGPVLDRIDLQVAVPALPPEDLLRSAPAEDSAHVAARVAEARARQQRRYAGRHPGSSNSELEGAEIRAWCPLGEAEARLLGLAIQRESLSGRSVDRLLKVARTIADLSGQGGIGTGELAEALLLRTGRDWSRAAAGAEA
ncbi:MAG: YifB family Mg chelatase-like AAA ATPase [Candidatus Delongbacteria bacterium]